MAPATDALGFARTTIALCKRSAGESEWP